MSVDKLRDNNYCDGIKPVKVTYGYDNDVQIYDHTIVTTGTVDSTSEPVSDIYIYTPLLSNCKDLKINNYSCLFLTNQQQLSSNTSIEIHENNKFDYTNGAVIYDDVFGNTLSAINGFNNNQLLNVQYTTVGNDTFPCNIVSFNNQKSYTNKTTYSNYWKDINNYYNTQSLLTGTRQEHGNTDIYTVDEFYMQDIEIQPGDNKIILPDTLFPFETIDINDTTFIKNGAFGSNSPSVSDRIYTNRYTTYGDNIILLCTWLSCNTDGDGVWLDRYYNPSVYHYSSDLKQLTTEEGNIVNAFDSFSALRLYGYFDKISDLTLKPNMELIYHRVSRDDINSYISTLNSTNISALSIKNKSNYNICVTDTCKLSGNIYAYSNTNTAINNNFAISLDVDIYNWENAEFYELFSSHSNNCGIRLYKRNPITPILLTYSDEKIKLYNTQFNLIDEFDVEGGIKDIKRDDNLSHIIVLYSHKVCIYTLFGALITEFNINVQENEYNKFNAIDVVDSTLYIADNNSVSAFNINTFEYLSSIPLTTSSNSIISIGGENESIIYSNKKYNSYVYVDKMNGVLYIDDEGIIRLRYNNDNICLMNPETDSKYMHLHTPIHVDEETKIESYTTYPILDFTINGDIVYAVTLNTLFVGDVNRTNLKHYTLPFMKNNNIKNNVNVISTTEMENSKYITKAFILISDKYQNDIDIYEFKNEKFTFIKTINNLQYYNLYNLTGNKNNPKISNDLYFDISFKVDNNKIITYSDKVNYKISSGKHTILINVNTKDKKCDLYVDDNLAHTHILTHSNLIYAYNILQNQIVFGNTLLYNGGDLASYIQSDQYLLKDISVGNLYVFNKYLSNENIRINALKSTSLPNIILNIPCGQRCKINHIESFYKQSIPGYKSTNFDIIIKNLQLSEKNQIILSNAIKNYITKYLPTTTHLENITFKNY